MNSLDLIVLPIRAKTMVFVELRMLADTYAIAQQAQAVATARLTLLMNALLSLANTMVYARTKLENMLVIVLQSGKERTAICSIRISVEVLAVMLL